METLARSFETYRGLRGVHLVFLEDCAFYPWNEVSRLFREVPDKEEGRFQESLLTVLSNYNPDEEFLVLNRGEESVSIELYTLVK